MHGVSSYSSIFPMDITGVIAVPASDDSVPPTTGDDIGGLFAVGLSAGRGGKEGGNA